MKNSDTENDKIVSQAVGSALDTEELIAPGTPIQFDIVLPASEFLDQNRGSRYVCLYSPPRTLLNLRVQVLSSC